MLHRSSAYWAPVSPVTVAVAGAFAAPAIVLAQSTGNVTIYGRVNMSFDRYPATGITAAGVAGNGAGLAANVTNPDRDRRNTILTAIHTIGNSRLFATYGTGSDVNGAVVGGAGTGAKQ